MSNNGTPAFSLKEAGDILQKHIEYLPFTLLKDCIDSDRKFRDGNDEYSLHTAASLVDIPGNLNIKDRVVQIPINTFVVLKTPKTVIVKEESFIYVRSDSGGTYGSWYYFAIEYQSGYEHDVHPLFTIHGRISSVPKKGLDISSIVLPKNYRAIFWSNIQRKIAVSIKKRRKTLNLLEKLNKTCKTESGLPETAFSITISEDELK